ncbi:tetratricopeptide repeat protein [Reyranella sp.]|uniref:tetratricopeptide repeat protein n=1 Tax=Reyranella sp. TaxID=1929291 RepID=UPI003BAD17B0
MRRTHLALLSAASLLILPAVGNGQQAPQPGAKPPAQRAAPPLQATPVSAIPLGGRYLAARIGEQDHDYAAASDQADLALAMAPKDPELVSLAFRLRLFAGRFDQAVQLAPQVLALKPADGLAHLVLAVQSIKKGDYPAAEQQMGRIGGEIQLGPFREYVMAWLKAGEKDFAGARARLAKLKAAAGQSTGGPSLVIEGQIEEMAGDKAAAEARYRSAASLDKTGLRTIVAAAEGLRRLGKDDEARDLLKKYGEKYADAVVMDGLVGPNAPMPPAPSTAAGISDILFDMGGLLSADPRNQRTDLSLLFYQLAASLQPENDFAWLMIAGIYEQFQMVPKAIQSLSAIPARSPLYWQARLRTAALDAQEDKFDQAVSRLKELIAEKPDRIDAALTLADLLRSKEKYADAVEAYDTAIQRINHLEERHWTIFFGRGIVLERTRQWPKAEADMKKALELSPEQPHVLNYLGYSWVDQGLHLDEGMKMLKRATELRPDDGAITDSVGWAYYRLGQYDKAVEWLERAAEQKGDDPTIIEHLGDAYWHVGRKREARFQWERALNQNPDKDRISIIRDKLSSGLSASNDKPTVYEKAKQGG